MIDPQDPNGHRLNAIDQAVLTPLVRKSLGSQTVTVTHWEYQPVSGGAGGGVGGTFVYRFTGQGEDQGTNPSWSLIVKILQARPQEDPGDPNYWKREAEIFRLGLLDDLPGDLSAPRCFDVVEYVDEACWIWEEDVHDDLGKAWSPEHYGLVARHLGQFNGAYLVGRPLPSASGLSTSWLRKIVQKRMLLVPQIYTALASPLLKAAFPSDASDTFSRLWAERDLFFDALDRLPQTFCHLDAFRFNLFARRGADGHFKTIAIDWAFAGHACIGAEIAHQIMDNGMLFQIDARDVTSLDSLIFNGYLAGLGDAGWKGDPQLIRLGYSVAVVAKYFEIATYLPFLADPQNVSMLEQITGHSIQDNARQAAEMFRFTHRIADEARKLLRQLN